MIGLGDTQVDNRGVPRATLRRALADAPGAQLVLQAGDVVNRPYKGSQWADLFTAMGSSARTRNWLVSIGNHEQCVLVLKCRANGAEAFRSYFDWPDNGFPAQGETWFHVDYQGVRIVVLDSFGGRMPEQAAFLDKALAENPNQVVDRADARPAVRHHARPAPTREVRDLLLPIIERHNVDLVLSGPRPLLRPRLPLAQRHGLRRERLGPEVLRGHRRGLGSSTAPRGWCGRRRTSTYQVITIAGDTLTLQGRRDRIGARARRRRSDPGESSTSSRS